MRKLITVFLVGIFLIGAVPANAALVIDETVSVTDMVQEILGSGITVSNISYTGAGIASGTFTGGSSSGLGIIESGIILTSGDATLAPGPNSRENSTGNNSLSGDSDLDTLAGWSTYDATILEFDFESTGGDVFFNYVFASEEYSEYSNTQYNDVFGFFLDGTNIALIPGTTTPVSINTVNGGNPGDIGYPVSAPVNPEYYNNNGLTHLPVAPADAIDIEYDGLTDVFRAEFLGLTTGTHHIKLAIADGSDYILDSAVFIQAGTFSDDPTPTVPVPGAFLLGMLGLSVAGVKLRRHA